MNLLSSNRLALLLFALVLLQAFVWVEAVDLLKIFDKKKNNRQQSSPEAETKAKKADSAAGALSADSDENIDKRLDQLTETSHRNRPRVDLARIRAATAEADRIAAANLASKKSPGGAEPDEDHKAEAHDDGRRRPGARRKVPIPVRSIGGQQGPPEDNADSVELESTSKNRPPQVVSTKPISDDRSLLKPSLKTRVSSMSVTLPLQTESEPKKSKFNMSYLKKKMNKGIKTGIKQVAKGISEIPTIVGQATDSLSAMLQLDSRGRILALIEEVKGDIHFVRKEFSKFSMEWTPIMEEALSYLGQSNLDKVKFNEKDELDFTKDALHSLAFGFEFMKLMIAWRENLLVAHEAYKLYLETVKDELAELKSTSNGVTVDEDFIFQMKTIHAYMLLTSWLSMNEVALEPRMKLDHLMEIEDDRPKNYESQYFRNIVKLQELYEPTIKEFDAEERQVTDAIGHAGALTEHFEDVDKFFDDFRTKLVENNIKSVDWEAPQDLLDFMAKMRPELQFNPLVYSKAFKNEIMQALERARRERESD